MRAARLVLLAFFLCLPSFLAGQEVGSLTNSPRLIPSPQLLRRKTYGMRIP
jgi:hypothetical protein